MTQADLHEDLKVIGSFGNERNAAKKDEYFQMHKTSLLFHLLKGKHFNSRQKKKGEKDDAKFDSEKKTGLEVSQF